MVIRYTSDSRNWNLDKALDEHVLCHTIQAEINRLHALPDFTNREKVQWVVATICKTKYNQTLLQIESEGAMGAHRDFDCACMLLCEHQRLLKAQATRNVSGVNSGDGGGCGHGRPSRGNHRHNNRDDRARGGGGGGSNGKTRTPYDHNAHQRDNTHGGRALSKATHSDRECHLQGIREGKFNDLAHK